MIWQADRHASQKMTRTNDPIFASENQGGMGRGTIAYGVGHKRDGSISFFYLIIKLTSTEKTMQMTSNGAIASRSSLES